MPKHRHRMPASARKIRETILKALEIAPLARCELGSLVYRLFGVKAPTLAPILDSLEVEGLIRRRMVRPLQPIRTRRGRLMERAPYQVLNLATRPAWDHIPPRRAS